MNGFVELSRHFIIYDSTAAQSGHYFITHLLFIHLPIPTSQIALYYFRTWTAFGYLLLPLAAE